MDKLNILNKIPVVEYSCSGDELEYVLVADTEQNREILKKLGMTKFDYKEMCLEGLIELSTFACNKLGAVGWQKEHGFLTYEQAKRLDVEWV